MNTYIFLQKSWYWKEKQRKLFLGSSLSNKIYSLTGDAKKLILILDLLKSGIVKEQLLPMLCQATGYTREFSGFILDSLKRIGCLVEGTDSFKWLGSEDRYKSQARFFQMYEKNSVSGLELQERLRNKKILTVGIGGYGSWVILNCARIGIRHIVAIDHDRVEESNLSRQVLYNKGDVGDLKIDACKRNLLRENPDIQFEGIAKNIQTASDLYPYLSGVDFVFNSFGYLSCPAFEAVAVAAGKMGIPSLTFGGSWIGPLNIPGRSPCYHCFLQGEKIQDVVHHSYGVAIQNKDLGADFCPRIATSMSLAVWEAARFLSGIDDAPTINGAVMLDLFRYQQPLFYPISHNKNCSVCHNWGTNE